MHSGIWYRPAVVTKPDSPSPSSAALSISPERIAFDVAAHGATSALVYRAKDPTFATLILAHGAGAPQTHPFMIDIASRLASRGIDVVTFNFPYAEKQKKLPDRNDVLEASWRAAIATVVGRGGLPNGRLFIGGKSMGGRIATQVASQMGIEDEDVALAGIVLLGYPLHPMGKPKIRRDAHLPSVPFPMLFVQGTRDELGPAAEMQEVVAGLQNAQVHAVEGGDHSLALLKREGADRQERALEEAADAIAHFIRGRLNR
jgi:predicted alpha/beta-hydrolase family hydrolase